jgi:hypothetical protein
MCGMGWCGQHLEAALSERVVGLVAGWAGPGRQVTKLPAVPQSSRAGSSCMGAESLHRGDWPPLRLCVGGPAAEPPQAVSAAGHLWLG